MKIWGLLLVSHYPDEFWGSRGHPVSLIVNVVYGISVLLSIFSVLGRNSNTPLLPPSSQHAFDNEYAFLSV